jgi:hypothetical protein
MLFALTYYAVSARHWFKGPLVNVEHMIHGVNPEGEESGSGSAENVHLSEKKE